MVLPFIYIFPPSRFGALSRYLLLTCAGDTVSGPAQLLMAGKGIRTIEVEKPTAESRLGIQLATHSKNRVKVSGLAPTSLFGKHLRKGDTLLKINGIAVQSHETAAEILTSAAAGPLRLEVASKRNTFASRLSGRRSSFEDIDTDVPTAEPSTEEHQPAPPAAESDPSASTAPVGSPALYMPIPPPEEPAPEQPQTMASQPPRPPDSPPRTDALPPRPTSSEPPLGLGEYRVILQRDKTASIGVRLVQRHASDLPFVADIDPAGPAAGTEIALGDSLLEVNGVDARATHDTLRRALSVSNTALLKLRCARYASNVSNAPNSKPPKSAASGKPLKSNAPDDPTSLFAWCCAERPAAEPAPAPTFGE
jgi:hypothetical protein